MKFLSLFLLLTLCSCYTMPTDDDYSVVPMINNKDVTKEKSQSATPQMGY